jgi:hypothetical protein
MPPIRLETSQKLAYQEDKILLAIDDIKNGRIKSLRAASRLYEVSSTIPHARASCLPSRVDSRPTSHKLTPLEEYSLTGWIISMDSRGASPWPATVREMANILLAARGSYSPLTVGKNWPSTFVQRRESFDRSSRDVTTTSAH